MGIVMAGMIDLMSISTFKINELGQSREIFLLGQRAGRISNVLTTLEREIYEKDITNEILSYNHKNTQSSITDLELELADIINRLMNYKNIKCFSTAKYSIGIKKLHDLHQNLKIFI
jgi:hypothetical protein